MHPAGNISEIIFRACLRRPEQEYRAACGPAAVGFLMAQRMLGDELDLD